MSIRILLAFIFSVGLAAASVYVYSVFDPRLEIIHLKNEEIMRLDNKIADLTEANKAMTEQVSSISTVVKTNETDTGKINDEYKICLRASKKQKKQIHRLNTEIGVLQNKNRIMKEYVQVKNEVISLQEEIDALNLQKKDLNKQLAPNSNDSSGQGGGIIPGSGEAGGAVEPIEN